MLGVICAEFPKEVLYSECRYAECQGAVLSNPINDIQ
jgi:hypothetical protein